MTQKRKETQLVNSQPPNNQGNQIKQWDTIFHL